MTILQYKAMEFLTDEEMSDHMYVYWEMPENESKKFVQSKKIISIVTSNDYTCYHDLLEIAPIINVPKCITKFSYDFSIDCLQYWQEGKLSQTMVLGFNELSEFLERLDDSEIC